MPADPADEPSAGGRGPDEAYCRNCGVIIDAEARYCPTCGAPQDGPSPSSGSSSLDAALDDLLEGGNPFVAALLSALFPGLGQLYNRELEKGLVIIAAGILAVFSAVILVGFVLYPAVWLYAIYDAYTVAERQSGARGPDAARDADDVPDAGPPRDD